MELFGLVMWQALLLILGICAVVSFGIVHLLKMLYAAYIASTPEQDKEPWYWDVGLRALAIVIGSLVGMCFSFAGVEFILALGLGFSGGVLNTMIVKIVKTRLKKFKTDDAVESQDDEIESQDGDDK